MTTTTTTEPPDGTETSSDGPLLDLTDAGVKKFIKQAKTRGYVTMDELNKVLPSEEVTSEQIEDTLAMLSEIDKAAGKSGAPFLDSDLPLAVARSQWSHVFESLTRMAALENEIGAAKAGLENVADAARLSRLKSERDALKRAIRMGTIWTDGV